MGCRFRHWIWCGSVMWLQNECLKWAKGSVRRTGGYSKGIDGNTLQNPQKCPRCRQEISVAGRSLPSNLKTVYSLFLGDHYKEIKNYTSASSCPEICSSICKNKTRTDDFSICIECFTITSAVPRTTCEKTPENINHVLWIGKWFLDSSVCWIAFVP